MGMGGMPMPGMPGMQGMDGMAVPGMQNRVPSHVRVERKAVPHVQGPGDVGRRNDHDDALALGPLLGRGGLVCMLRSLLACCPQALHLSLHLPQKSA